MLIWVKNAPILGKSPDSEVADFIQKYVTCKIPDQKESPSLYEKVTKCQRHVHNSYCLRKKKINLVQMKAPVALVLDVQSLTPLF